MSIQSELNKEAKKKEKRKKRIRNRHNREKILKILLFWIYYPAKWIDDFNNWRYYRIAFSEEKTKRLFDKYLPKIIANAQNQFNLIVFSNHDEYHPLWDWQNNLTRKAFVKSKKARRYFNKFYSETKAYLLRNYEMEGYKRIYFRGYAPNILYKHFGLNDCYPNHYTEGVIFYNPLFFSLPDNGEWEVCYDEDEGEVICSVCGMAYREKTDTCPNCKAKMEVNGNAD